MRSIETISVKFMEANMHRMNYVAKFVCYKYSFNSLIYNYTPYRAHSINRVAFSKSAIDSHIKKFISFGWCYVDKKGTLVFKSKVELTKTVSRKKTSYYILKCNLNYKEIRTHLYGAVLTRKLVQMKHASLSKSKVKSRGKKVHSHNREGLTIGLRKMKGLFWYKSISSVKHRVRECVEGGLVKSRRFRPQKMFCLNLNDFIYRNPCTQYFLVPKA